MKNKIYKLVARISPNRLLYFMIIRSWDIVISEKHEDKRPSEITWDTVCLYLYKRN